MNKKNRSLKQSLTLGAVFFTIVICAVFSIGMVLTFEAIEEALLTPHFQREAEDYVALYETAPEIINVPQKDFELHIDPVGDLKALPAHLRPIHRETGEMSLGGEDYYLVRIDHGKTAYYFFFDESKVEALEVLLFVVMVTADLILIALALVISVLISRRVVSPMEELANQIDGINDGEMSSIRLKKSRSYPKEIIKLANALEDFRVRINSSLTREQEFSSNVSHELRTPLAAITGAVEILEMSVESDQNKTDLYRRIGRNSRYMNALTESLLFLVKTPNAKNNLLEEVSLRSVVNWQIEQHGALAKSRGVTIKSHCEDDFVVRAIPAVVNIVLSNIVRNAINYTNHHEVIISLAGAYLVVQDHGPGVKKAELQKIHDRLERGLLTTESGTGIGLWLAKRFCEEFNWSFQFDSDESSGTRVAIKF